MSEINPTKRTSSDTGCTHCGASDDSQCTINDDINVSHNYEWSEELTINRLPDTILLTILSYLPRTERLKKAALTCRYWHNLTRDSSFWRNLDLKQEKMLDDTILQRISRFSCNLTSLVLDNSSQVTDDGLLDVIDHCKELRMMKLIDCKKFTGKSLNCIGDKLKHLSTMVFHCCLNVTDETVIKIARGCSQLSKLRVFRNDHITDKSIVAVAQFCKKLRYLDISQNYVTDISILKLVEEQSKLQMLICFDTLISGRATKLLSQLSHLKSLYAHHNVNDDVLLSLAEGCKALQGLDLHRCDEVTCAGLINATKHLGHLTMLVLDCPECEIDDAVLESIGKHCLSLEKMVIGYSSTITEVGINAVMSGCPQFTKLYIKCDEKSAKLTESLASKYSKVILKIVPIRGSFYKPPKTKGDYVWPAVLPDANEY